MLRLLPGLRKNHHERRYRIGRTGNRSCVSEKRYGLFVRAEVESGDGRRAGYRSNNTVLLPALLESLSGPEVRGRGFFQRGIPAKGNSAISRFLRCGTALI